MPLVHIRKKYDYFLSIFARSSNSENFCFDSAYATRKKFNVHFVVVSRVLVGFSKFGFFKVGNHVLVGLCWFFTKILAWAG
jgi:hypothetical protein